MKPISENEFVTAVSTNRVRFILDRVIGAAERLVLKSRGAESRASALTDARCDQCGRCPGAVIVG